MRRTRRRATAGFTLTELMVVMAIIGVLVATAYPLLRARPRAIDHAETIAARIAEASRRAIAGGAVRPNVVQALGLTARTRVVVELDASSRVTVSTERLVEDLPVSETDASWQEIRRIALHRDMRVVGWSASPTLSSTSGPANLLSAGQTKDIYCQPDGRCDGIMLFLETADGRTRARVVVLPLGGAPVTFTSW